MTIITNVYLKDSVRRRKRLRFKQVNVDLHHTQRTYSLKTPYCSQANSAFYPQRDGKWVPANVRWRSAAGE